MKEAPMASYRLLTRSAKRLSEDLRARPKVRLTAQS